MKIFLAKLLFSALAVLLLGWLLPGVHVSDSFAAVLVAVVLALLNAIVRPILILFTLPITIITLGLFLAVINGCIILIADSWLKGFRVDGFWWAVLFGLLLAVLNGLFEKLLIQNQQLEQ